MDLFTLKATLGLDTSEYQRKVSEIIDQAKKDGETLSDALSAGKPSVSMPASGGQTQTGGGWTFGKQVSAEIAAQKVMDVAQWVIDAGKESVGLASSLEEVLNVVDVTFGENAGKIDRWSQMQAGDFGLSEMQAKQFAGFYGNMLQAAGISADQSAEMAMQLSQLAGDMASFYNIGIEEAYGKIQSGLAGETEPLMRYGIDMRAGALEEYTGRKLKDMTTAEQLQARYDYLMERSAPVQGDYERTAEGYANSQRTLENNLNRLKTQFGDQIMPVLTAGTNAANKFFEAIYAQSAEETLEGIDNAAENAKDGIGEAAENARAMVGVLDDYGDKTALTADEQARWDAVVKELVRTIPELSTMIDRQTGEIDGGTAALMANIDAWEEAGKAGADTAAMAEKEKMLTDINAEIAQEQAMLDVAQKRFEQSQGEVIALGASVAETLGREFDGTAESVKELLSTNIGRSEALKTGLSKQELLDLMRPVSDAAEAIEEHKENIAALQQEYATVEQSIAGDSGLMSDIVAETAGSVTESFAEIEQATNSVVANFDQRNSAYAASYGTGIAAADGLNDALPAYAAAAGQYTFAPARPPAAGALARDEAIAREMTREMDARGGDDALIEEVRALRQDISQMQIVMDNGALVGQIAPGINRWLGQEVARHRR
ncbi:MAG: hypothetical protein IJD60_06400 [Clostridia bacterium]|nr:hypothetical protein [Clostridia bacterium]